MSAKTKPAPQPEAAAAAAPPSTVAVPAPTIENPDNLKAITVLKYAQEFTVFSASDSAKGQEARTRVNAEIKLLNDKRMELTRPLDALKKKWMEFFAGPLQKLEQAKQLLDGKLLAYENEQERWRKVEQARLDKIAEDERRRLQAIADEAKRKADAEAAEKRKQAEAAAGAGRAAEAARLNAQAARVEEKADAKAEVFETRAASVAAPIAQADTAKVAGASFREMWEFEVTDLSKINATFLMADEVKIGRVVQSLKADAVGVVGAGIKVTSRKILATRRT